MLYYVDTMSILRQIFETLREHYAAKPNYPWWPENPIEVIFGAILVAGSTWPSVDKILAEFRSKELLDFRKILQLPDDELATLIRPAGLQSKKAPRIRAIAHLILERSGGDLDLYFSRDFDEIRRELLSISGIGPSTADNILLYAGHVPIYMVDMFTVRMLVRHGIVGAHVNDFQIQELIHRELTPDEEPYGAKLFQKMQEYLVRLGRDFCDKSRPNCWHCPLNSYLPEGGALGISEKPSPKVLQPRIQPRTLPNVSVQPTPKPVALPELNETELQIIEAIGKETMPIDDLVEKVQLPVHIVRATIAVLQMKKLVCQVEGNQVRRVSP